MTIDKYITEIWRNVSYIILIISTFRFIFVFGSRSRSSFHPCFLHHHEGTGRCKERTVDETLETRH